MIQVMILELQILAHAAVLQPELSQGLAGVQDIMAILQSKVTLERERCKLFECVSYITQRIVDVDINRLPLVMARDSNVDRALRDNRLRAGLGPVWKSTSESGAPDNSSLGHFSATARP